MLKIVAAAATALFVTASPLAYAQTPSASAPERSPSASAQERLSAADRNTLTDLRIDLVKAALQLTPDQQKYWPAVEEAIRARAQTLEQRLATVEERLEHQPLSVDPIAFMHARADALAQRAASLKKLADAWQPLHQILNPDQRQRMRLLVADVLRDLRDALQTRRIEATGRGG